MKEKIIAAATTLFVQKGYYQTTMEDVAKEAGIAKGSLYYHFKNKAQLFCDTVLDGIAYFENLIKDVINKDIDNNSITEELIALLVNMCIDNQKIVDMVMSESSVGIEKEIALKIKAAKEHFINLIADAIGQGIQIRLLRKCNTVATAAAIISFAYAYCKQLRETNQTNSAQTVEQISKLLMKGLLV